MKETRLQEDAYIYSKREETDEKQKWKNLDRAGKFQYFKDYYLKKLIIGGLAAAGVIWLLVTVLTPEPEMDLYIALINSSAPQEKEELLTGELAALLGSESVENITLDSSYFIHLEEMDQGSLGSIQRLSAQAYTKMVDAVIADEEEFHYFARQGYFMDMAEALPTDLYSRLADNIYLDRMELEKSEGIRYGEDIAYGISLKGFEGFEALETGMENPVLGIVANTEKRENGIKALKYLTR